MSKKYLVTQDQTVDGVLLDGDPVHFATCSTSAATAAKTAALSGFKLIKGAWAAVKFTFTNTAAQPTLNINNTGAKEIRYRSSTVNAGVLATNRIYLMVYDGSYWQIVGDLDTNTTYNAASSSVAGLMSAADKIKLNNTMSVTSIVQGTLGSLTSTTGTYYISNLSRASKALIEYWSDVTSITSSGDFQFSHSNYGSRYITGISPSMNPVTASSLMMGPSRSIDCGVDNTGRPYFSGSISKSDHYRITWYL